MIGSRRAEHADTLWELFNIGTPEDTDWMRDGLCAQTDPEEFYPHKGGSTRTAKAICAACPVRSECLTYALEHDERYGVWGGTSERERRALRREAPADAATAAVDRRVA